MVRYICLCALLMDWEVALATPDYTQWKLQHEENSIQVYTLDVKKSDLLKARAVAVITAPMKDIQQVIDDIDNRHEWVPYLRKSERVAVISDTRRIEYSVFKAPWPASDRDFVYELQILKATENYLIYKMVSVDNALVAEKNSIIRAELFECVYSLTAISENTTGIEVIYYADPKGWLPDWLVNIIQVKFPYRILLNLQSRFNGTL